MTHSFAMTLKKRNSGFIWGLGITLAIAIAAKYIAELPFMNIMGQLVIAILIGMGFRAVAGVPERASAGIAFSSKTLLRYGIILLGMRLNLTDIIHAGPKVLAIALINIVTTIFVVLGFARLLKVDRKLGLLTACGTAICGAAAVVAISPQIKARDEETAIGAASVAILGTIFTLVYTLMYPILGLSEGGYGIFAGATLHEVAHAIAAAAPGGQEAVDLAVIVKLTRVAMLVPVALILGIWMRRRENKHNNGTKGAAQKIPVPWFIFGFLAMSGLNTLHIVPEAAAGQLIVAAYILIAMAMAALGLGVDLPSFFRLGRKSFMAGLLGSIVLAVLGFLLVRGFGLA
ncbi:YeiH family protein [Paenibacillus nasutitermitis]|uniref:UPF0324 membrane protein n=1 Tax=Paenibacillus nasutitermitis TaxID=1652958 RepID=A0A916YWI8_9BACL|nr:YeiH family protein [Paenibacillus nasutitermitis]GGD64583.1 UPF0324 membrane protein [Paenibacillus nasutitermitis]